jgi:hypothetical protein
LFCEGRIALATPDVATIRDHFMDGFRCGDTRREQFPSSELPRTGKDQIVRANLLAND